MFKFILLFLTSALFAQINTITLRDGFSKTFQMQVTQDSAGNISTIHTAKPFELAVSMGQVNGYATQDKFGYNPLITTATDPEDIWEGGGLYTYDDTATAPIISIASDSASDTNIPIKVTGLNINGNEVSFVDTINGTTRVALSTPLYRVHRLQNESDQDLNGTVFVYTGSGTVPSIGDPEVRAVIDNGNNQTLMALYTIPREYVGFLYRGEVGVEWEGGGSASGDFARIIYKSRRYGKTFKIKKLITCITTGNSIFQDYRSFHDIIPGLTDIRIQVAEVSVNMGAWAAFDILLVPVTEFTPGYLTAIGQPGYN